MVSMDRFRAEQTKERLQAAARYTVRLLPIVIIASALVWFFVLRSPSDQTNTSGTGDDTDTTSETTVDTTNAESEEDSTLAVTTAEGGKEDAGKLPDAGPADTLAYVAVVVVAGTIFWEWRQRRTGQNA